jgi:2-oxoglutarate ferredoxin oxidoreductase subunit beta
MTMAVALDASFAARGFAGDTDYLKELMKAAIEHKGFTLLDILQPCVTFNKVNTYDWYRERVYHIEDDYSPEDRTAAFGRSLEWGAQIPTGIIYRSERPAMEERIPVIRNAPLIKQSFDIETGKRLIESLRV